MNKSPWIKVGAIWKKKDDKNKKYLKVANTVTLTQGQFLAVVDPRKKSGITEEQLAKIPEGLVAEILIAPENN